MKTMEVKLSRLIPGPIDEVFDVWFDPARPGGPWGEGAVKALMSFAVDGMFYFATQRPNGLHAHFGRFTSIERSRSVTHTWMSENTRGLETTVNVTFEPQTGGTLMTIVHSGLPDDEGGRRHEAGWTHFLTRIDQRFEKEAKA